MRQRSKAAMGCATIGQLLHCNKAQISSTYSPPVGTQAPLPMLYQFYETQRAFLQPFADFAKASAEFYSNPLLPFAQTQLSQRMAAGFDLFYRLSKDYPKPQFGISSLKLGDAFVAVREMVVMDKPFCELRQFKRFSDDQHTLQNIHKHPAVLVVAPLSGHYATLLRETVRSLMTGHKVFITDWKNARNVPLSQGTFGLDDYVNYVQDFIRVVQQRYGSCHVISVCQPTVPVLAAISLMSSRGEPVPLSMTMMGGPIDARRSPTAVNTLAMQRSFEWFENNVIFRVPSNYPGAGRRVYPGFLQYTGFVAMNPDRHAGSHYDYFKNLSKGDDASAQQHRKFYDEYNAVLDLDAPFYLETIRTVFQEFRLVNGTWDVRSPEGKLERVRPQDITQTALLTVEGELDDISGSGQTHAAHDLCTQIPQDWRGRVDVLGAGHYGIFSGRRWRESVHPRIADFIAKVQQRSGQSAHPRYDTSRSVAEPVVPTPASPSECAVAAAATQPEASPQTPPCPAPSAVAEPQAVCAERSAPSVDRISMSVSTEKSPAPSQPSSTRQVRKKKSSR